VDDGATTGGWLWISNLGWKGAAELCRGAVPQLFDLWQDPQDAYDIFMNNYTERLELVTVGEAVKELMKTYVQYPPRKMQSEGYSGPHYPHLKL